MEEAQTWDAPLLSSTWTLIFWVGSCKVFPCTECFKRAIVGTSAQPYFVSCTHEQVRYYLAHIFPRFVRLLISNTESPRVKKKNKNNTGYIYHKKWNNGSYLRSIFDVTLPGPPGITIYQEYYGGCYKKQSGHTCNGAMKMQTPRSR
jgi:hypothetical protein